MTIPRSFYTLGLILFWPIWSALAITKDLLEILYVPFDSQRGLDTYITMVKIAKQLGQLQDYQPDTQQPEPEEPTQKPVRNPIGFRTCEPANCEVPKY